MFSENTIDIFDLDFLNGNNTTEKSIANEIAIVDEDDFIPVVNEENKKKILETLNENQRAVVENYKGFSLVAAGPGSGILMKHMFYNNVYFAV